MPSKFGPWARGIVTFGSEGEDGIYCTISPLDNAMAICFPREDQAAGYDQYWRCNNHDLHTCQRSIAILRQAYPSNNFSVGGAIVKQYNGRFFLGLSSGKECYSFGVLSWIWEDIDNNEIFEPERVNRSSLRDKDVKT